MGWIGGCETCYTTIALFEFARGILDKDDVKLAKGLLIRNQNNLNIVQKQINPGRILRKIKKESEQQNQILNDSNDVQIQYSDGDDLSGESDDSELENQMKIKNVGGPEKEVKKGGGEKNIFLDGSINEEDIYLDLKADALSDQMEVDEDNMAKDKNKKQANIPQVADGVQIDLNKIIEIEAYKEDKDAEEEERNAKIESLQKKVDKMSLKIEDVKSTEKLERMKM